jgi:bifunctional DNA-binding transcriptional regulator/antitoxin component of YhaV-PrlF toxin-antitoxin module
MRFETELLLNGKTATGIAVPEGIVEKLGGGRRAPVTVSLNGYTFQTSLGTVSGQVMIPVSAAVRGAAGVEAGDLLVVDIEPRTEPVVVEVPEDLRAALAAEPQVRTFFEGLTASQQRGYTEWVDGAKTAETRQRRLELSLQALRERRTHH